MSETKTVRAKILRDFKDAGDERQFTAGETLEIGEGAFGNYHAAGLVERASVDAATDGEPAKSGRARG